MGAQHLIRKFDTKVRFENAEKSVAWQNELGDFVKFELLPELEKEFDRICSEGQTIRIDKLEIQAGTLDPSDWKRQLTDIITAEIKKQVRDAQWSAPLEQSIRNALGTTTSSQKNLPYADIFDTTLYFLRNGTLPWYFQGSSEDLFRSVEELLGIGSKRFISQFFGRFADNENAIKRFLIHLSESYFHNLVQLLEIQPAPPEFIFVGPRNKKLFFFEFLIKYFDFENYRFSGYLTQKAIAYFSHGYSPFSEDKNTLIINWALLVEDHIQNQLMLAAKALEGLPTVGQDALNNNKMAGADTQTAEPPTQRPTTEKPTGRQIYYISNAGLILLHPFLENLFENCGLWKDNNWLYDDSQEKAVILTHFLYSDEQPEESELVLNKLLCGLPIEQPVDIFYRPETALLEECRNLLLSVISHWQQLKNTSAEGLQNTFLLREGRITIDMDLLHLMVERSGVDVLLGSLPWGIGTIRTPFMKQFLNVEW